MGDRAMAVVKTEGGSIYVYTHRGGSELPNDAKKAVIAAKPRWDDYPYATRIIIDQLTKGGRDQETGYGILLRPDAEDSYNNDSPSVIIDLLNKELSWILPSGEFQTISFQDLKEGITNEV